MTDNDTEIGLGTDLDLSSHNVKQGTNNVMSDDENGYGIFPNGIKVGDNGKFEVSDRIYFNENADLKNFSIYNYEKN